MEVHDVIDVYEITRVGTKWDFFTGSVVFERVIYGWFCRMKVSEEDAKQKLRVTILSWDKSDQWVITASSDNSIKVWNSVNGDLIQILIGHRAETYVMESHPLDSKVGS